MYRHLLGTILFVASVSAQTPGSWFAVTSEHFTLYTQDPAHARETLGDFERADAFFDSAQLLMPAAGPMRPVLLLTIPTEAEFARFRVGPATTAYFLTTDDFDCIVIGPVAQRERRAAVHEYVHLRVQRAGIKIPVWLNEGLAEYYSTLKVERQGRVSTGEAIPGHVKQLGSGWIPFASIFSLGGGAHSGFYQHAQLAAEAYSESWAAAHMLQTAEPWRGRWAELLAALTRGLDTQQALQQVYSVSVASFEQAVHDYARRWPPRLISYELPAFHENFEALSQPADGFRVQFALAVALADRASRIAALQRVSELYPQRPEPNVMLAYQLWRERGIASATEQFQHAYENGTGNTQALWDYGKLLLNAHDPRCADVLRKVAAAWPERDEVRLLIAQWELMNKHWAESLRELDTVKQPPAGQEAIYYEALIVSCAETGQYERAREALTRLTGLPLTPEQRDRSAIYKQRIGAP